MHSLRGRAVTALAVASVVVLATYLTVVFFIFREQLQRTTDRELMSYASAVAAATAEGGALPPPPLDAGQLGAIVVDPAGRVVDVTTNFEIELTEHGSSKNGEENSSEDGGEEGSVLSELVARASPTGRFVNLTGEHGTPLRAWSQIITIEAAPWVVATIAPISTASRPASRLLVVSGLTLAAVLALSAGIAWWAGGLVVRPLERLATDVHNLDESHLASRVQVPDGTREVGDLATAINSMLARIDSALQHERSFLADASHELRNPLSSLRGELELALRDADPARLRAGIEGGIEEVDRLSRLSDDILLLARLDVGTEMKLGSVSLAAVAAQTILDHAQRAEARGVTLALGGDDHTVKATDLLAQRALANLVENAIRHAPRDSTVDINTWRDGDRAGIDVVDRGPGIPSAERARVFERFARVDSARSRSEGGTGLGLAITTEIMAALGGEVSLESADPGHTKFRLSFTAG